MTMGSQGPFVRNLGAEEMNVWRMTDWGELAAVRPVTVVKDNGTTPFGVIDGGTVMGKITASGKYRPCFKGVVNGAQTSVNEVQLATGQAKNAYVGDEVSIMRPSTGATIESGRTITAVDKAAHKVTLSGGAVSVLNGDLIQLEDGAQVARAILDRKLSTTYFNRVTGGLVAEDVGPVKLWPTAVAKSASHLYGWNAHVAADLPGVYVE
jgi:hypothetical protein